jgi:hypothetical protein
LVGIALANIISRSIHLSKPECVAISIECCYQNVSIATSIAISMFDDPIERSQAVSVPLLYGIVEAVVIGFYCLWAWKMGWTKAPASESFCVVVSKTYEVSEDPATAAEEAATTTHETGDPEAQNDTNVAAIDTTMTATDTITHGQSKGDTNGDLEQGERVSKRSTGTIHQDDDNDSPSLWTRLFPPALIRWVSSSFLGNRRRSSGTSSPSSSGDKSSTRHRRQKSSSQSDGNRCRLVSEDNTATTCGTTTCSVASSPGGKASIKHKTNEDDDDDARHHVERDDTDLHYDHDTSLQRIEEGDGHFNDSRDTEDDEESS